MNKSHKNNGFKTPEGYFDGLADKLIDKLSEPDSYREGSVLPEKEGFVVPENYFDTLKESIDDKINREKTKVVQLNPYRKYYFAAASIAAVALVIFGLSWNTKGAPPEWDITATDVEAYFEDNDLELSSYEIAEVIAVDELEINDILETQLNEENVIDYLNDNIDDFDELNLDSDE